MFETKETIKLKKQKQNTENSLTCHTANPRLENPCNKMENVQITYTRLA